MKAPAMLGLSFLLLTGPVSSASTLRCGSDLVSLDDHTGEVQNKCGEPLSRDFIGYRVIVGYYGERSEVQIEEWAYGPRNGMYNYLRFEGNRLVKIESKRGN
ncbi:DUF2845 domain-containing protein [Pseudomonas cavernicola]|nr:DUF2845 domain-containing protein [Pseudomonas cavernicola]